MTVINNDPSEDTVESLRAQIAQKEEEGLQFLQTLAADALESARQNGGDYQRHVRQFLEAHNIPEPPRSVNWLVPVTVTATATGDVIISAVSAEDAKRKAAMAWGTNPHQNDIINVFRSQVRYEEYRNGEPTFSVADNARVRRY